MSAVPEQQPEPKADEEMYEDNVPMADSSATVESKMTKGETKRAEGETKMAEGESKMAEGKPKMTEEKEASFPTSMEHGDTMDEKDGAEVKMAPVADEDMEGARRSYTPENKEGIQSEYEKEEDERKSELQKQAYDKDAKNLEAKWGDIQEKANKVMEFAGYLANQSESLESGLDDILKNSGKDSEEKYKSSTGNSPRQSKRTEAKVCEKKENEEERQISWDSIISVLEGELAIAREKLDDSKALQDSAQRELDEWLKKETSGKRDSSEERSEDGDQRKDAEKEEKRTKGETDKEEKRAKEEEAEKEKEKLKEEEFSKPTDRDSPEMEGKKLTPQEKLKGSVSDAKNRVNMAKMALLMAQNNLNIALEGRDKNRKKGTQKGGQIEKQTCNCKCNEESSGAEKSKKEIGGSDKDKTKQETGETSKGCLEFKEGGDSAESKTPPVKSDEAKEMEVDMKKEEAEKKDDEITEIDVGDRKYIVTHVTPEDQFNFVEGLSQKPEDFKEPESTDVKAEKSDVAPETAQGEERLNLREKDADGGDVLISRADGIGKKDDAKLSASCPPDVVPCGATGKKDGSSGEEDDAPTAAAAGPSAARAGAGTDEEEAEEEEDGGRGGEVLRVGVAPGLPAQRFPASRVLGERAPRCPSLPSAFERIFGEKDEDLSSESSISTAKTENELHKKTSSVKVDKTPRAEEASTSKAAAEEAAVEVTSADEETKEPPAPGELLRRRGEDARADVEADADVAAALERCDDVRQGALKRRWSLDAGARAPEDAFALNAASLPAFPIACAERAAAADSEEAAGMVSTASATEELNEDVDREDDASLERSEEGADEAGAAAAPAPASAAASALSAAVVPRAAPRSRWERWVRRVLRGLVPRDAPPPPAPATSQSLPRAMPQRSAPALALGLGSARKYPAGPALGSSSLTTASVVSLGSVARGGEAVAAGAAGLGAVGSRNAASLGRIAVFRTRTAPATQAERNKARKEKEKEKDKIKDKDKDRSKPARLATSSSNESTYQQGTLAAMKKKSSSFLRRTLGLKKESNGGLPRDDSAGPSGCPITSGSQKSQISAVEEDTLEDIQLDTTDNEMERASSHIQGMSKQDSKAEELQNDPNKTLADVHREDKE